MSPPGGFGTEAQRASLHSLPFLHWKQRQFHRQNLSTYFLLQTPAKAGGKRTHNYRWICSPEQVLHPQLFAKGLRKEWFGLLWIQKETCTPTPAWLNKCFVHTGMLAYIPLCILCHCILILNVFRCWKTQLHKLLVLLLACFSFYSAQLL